MQTALHALVKAELIAEDENGGFEPTKVGLATVASGFGPDEGSFLYRELSKALKQFNLETEMHVIYHSTPIYGMTDVNWRKFRDELSILDESGIRTAQFVGVNFGFVNSM